MTALTPASSTGPPMMRAGASVRVRLPAGGWQIGFHSQPDGHTVVEVTDPAGSLVGWVAGARLPVVSIDAGWAGRVSGPTRSRHWWALAIGHVPTGADQPTVTFIRRTRRRRAAPPQETVDGLWVVHDGLWVAATAGRYTHVRLTARSASRVQRLRLVTDLPAPPRSLSPGGP